MITLKTLHEATEQEVFDQVARHLLTQNAKSMNETRNCRYRGNDNLQCAAGCLIADDEYDEILEMNTWEELVGYKWVPEKHALFINELQAIHDECTEEVWIEELDRVATERNLNTSVLDEFK